MAKESDIISIAVGETWRHAGMVAKASGSAITGGICNYYLKCVDGTNVGKWWKDSDQTWAAVETANAMTHQGDGNWTIELSASPFVDGEIYVEYAKESGALHVAGEGRLLRGQAAGMSLTAAERNSVADAILGRDVSNVEAMAAEDSLCMVVLGARHGARSDLLFTIYRTNNSTVFTTAPLTVSAALNPVASVAGT